MKSTKKLYVKENVEFLFLKRWVRNRFKDYLLQVLYVGVLGSLNRCLEISAWVKRQYQLENQLLVFIHYFQNLLLFLFEFRIFYVSLLGRCEKFLNPVDQVLHYSSKFYSHFDLVIYLIQLGYNYFAKLMRSFNAAQSNPQM